jgi:hypothetical protein
MQPLMFQEARCSHAYSKALGRIHLNCRIELLFHQIYVELIVKPDAYSSASTTTEGLTGIIQLLISRPRVLAILAAVRKRIPTARISMSFWR